MCRGKAWPEQATTQAPGDRSRGWARTVLMINPPASRVADVHSIGVPERWQLRLRDLPPLSPDHRVRDHVDREADRVLAVRRVSRRRVAVGDEDLVAAHHPLDVLEQSNVDHLAREPGDVDELAAARRLAEMVLELDALHGLDGLARLRRRAEREDERDGRREQAGRDAPA